MHQDVTNIMILLADNTSISPYRTYSPNLYQCCMYLRTKNCLNRTTTPSLTVAGEATSRSMGSNMRLICGDIWMISPLIRHSFLLSSSTVFMFSIHTASTGPSKISHFLSGLYGWKEVCAVWYFLTITHYQFSSNTKEEWTHVHPDDYMAVWVLTSEASHSLNLCCHHRLWSCQFQS